MDRKTKITALIMAAVLILCMGAVIWVGIENMHRNIQAVSAGDYPRTDAITGFKTLRQQLRAMQKAQLNDIAHDPESDAELCAMAKRQLLDLCTREEQENTIEGILSVRGWENPVVTVHKESVNVILKANDINLQESSVILDLVCRETGVQSGNVKIIPIN